MKHSISNRKIKVGILNTGAEICSIQSQKTGKEFMWNANPDIWASYAPVLFPAIGSFKNKQCTIDGTTYKIPKHGFIRHNNSLIVKEKTNESLNLQLDYSVETLKIYPYKFRFNIIFSLQENKLVVSHQVQNQDNKSIYFSLGGHPAFKCPVNDTENYEDYYLEFEHTENANTTLLGANGLISDHSSPVLKNTKVLHLTKNMFDKDALIFKDLKSRKVSLKSKKSDQVLSLDYTDFNYLGIWAKPKAPFVCIEPWLGIADHENSDGDFLKKDGIIELPYGEIFQSKYAITITE